MNKLYLGADQMPTLETAMSDSGRLTGINTTELLFKSLTQVKET